VAGNLPATSTGDIDPADRRRFRRVAVFGIPGCCRLSGEEFIVRKAICLLLLALLPVLGADISGAWDFTVNTEAGTGNPAFVFQQQGDKLTGTYKGLLGEAKVTGTVTGEKVAFSFDGQYDGNKIKVEYTGTIEGPTSMKGTVRFAALGEGTWSAKKK
jgi:hypothetical protein